MKRAEQKVIWQPMPGPQTALIQCPVFEVFYGGARGGGKTEGSIGDWLQHSATYGENAVGIFFRRTRTQLIEVIERTHQLFPKIGATYRGSPDFQWTMPGGARLKFAYLERDKDAEEYQGHSYTRVYVEEITNFPTPKPINLLRATLRSAVGVPVGLRLTGNPGGPGHEWVKRRFVTPNKQGWQLLKEQFTNSKGQIVELERVFIPSKITDNTLIDENDPMYQARLQQTGNAELVRAWLEGDWDLVIGSFFDCFSPTKHVLPAKDWFSRIPPHAMLYRSFDWGSAKPFSVGWYAVSDGTWGLPRGALLKSAEWYGSAGDNVGLKMNAQDVARGLLAKEGLLGWSPGRVGYGVADPSIFVRDGGPSIAEAMATVGCLWRPADNKRIPGWEAMRMRLLGNGGTPMLYFLDTCQDTIRTVASVQHDENKVEDVDTDGEDHAVDETRYACMAKPWIVDAPPEPESIVYPKAPHQLTINELLEANTRRRLALEDSV